MSQKPKCTGKLEGFRMRAEDEPRTLECELDDGHSGYCCQDMQYWPSSSLMTFLSPRLVTYQLYPNHQIGIRFHVGFCRSAKGVADCMLRWKHPGYVHQQKAKVWVDKNQPFDIHATRN